MKILQNPFFPTAMLVLAMAAPVRAADLAITLDSNTVSGAPGNVMTFTGTLRNLDASIVDLNYCQINMAGQFVTDCGAFLTFAPFTLDPFNTSPSFTMFTITVNLPYTDAAGPQSGTLDLFGGVEGSNGYNAGAQNLLGTASFSVNEVNAVTYLAGDVAPYTSDVAPNFGDGAMDILDLIQELFAVNSVPGFVPVACSDRHDAMDLFPADAASTRGGDGVLDIRDLILELFRVNNLDPARPVRSSRGGVCAGGSSGSSISLTEVSRNAASLPRPQTRVQGTLALGAPEQLSGGQERVSVYLRATQDLLRVAVTFGLGDRQSQLRFVAAPETPPSLAQDGQLGVVAAAWLDGVSVRAGERLLLGYVTGPAGALANLRVFGISASGLDDNREVPLNAAAESLRQ